MAREEEVALMFCVQGGGGGTNDLCQKRGAGGHSLSVAREEEGHAGRRKRNSTLPESIAKVSPFGPIEGHKWFFQISNQ